MDETYSLGAWLKGLRERADMTQEALAADVGVGKRSIERWEADDATPRGPSFIKLLSALGVDVGPSDAPRSVSAQLKDIRDEIAALRELPPVSTPTPPDLSSIGDEAQRRMMLNDWYAAVAEQVASDPAIDAVKKTFQAGRLAMEHVDDLDLSGRLQALEAVVTSQGEATTKALRALAREVRALARLQGVAAPAANRIAGDG